MRKIDFTENGLEMKFVVSEEGRIELKKLAAFGDEDLSIPFCQVHVAGGDRSAHHGAKLYCASESSSSKYVTHRSRLTDKGRLVEIVTASDLVEITTALQFFDSVRGFRVTNTVRNRSSQNICLEEVNGFSFLGLDGGESPDNLYLYVPHNSWYVEAQWQRYSLFELGLSSGNGVTSMKRFSVGNTGTWSTKEYLPMGIFERPRDSAFLLWQIENNGSWHYEIGDYGGKYYLNTGGPNCQDNGWTTILKPGEIFSGTACSIMVGTSLNEVLSEVTCLRRQIHRYPQDFEQLPVIFNSYMHLLWDYPSERALPPIVDSASDLGCEVFCIDAGWHDEDDWWLKLGDWQESESRFPNGIKDIVEYIKSKGMKAGLWLEIEDIGPNCRTATELPRNCFFTRNGELVRDHNRLILNFADPQVQARATRIVERMIAFGIEYIKLDYNVEGGNGTEIDSCSFGEGLLRHNHAFLDWLCELRDRFPWLTIENCASGGCRMDYAMLSVCSLQSTSDQTDYIRYAYLCSNLLSAVLPEQCGVWCYPCAEVPEDAPAGSVVDDERTVMNVINGLMGRFYVASRLHLSDARCRHLVSEGIRYYKRIRSEKKLSQPYLPLGFSTFRDDVLASGFRTGKKLYLAVWNMRGIKRADICLPELVPVSARLTFPTDMPVDFYLKGNMLSIDFNKEYQARFFEINLS